MFPHGLILRYDRLEYMTSSAFYSIDSGKTSASTTRELDFEYLNVETQLLSCSIQPCIYSTIREVNQPSTSSPLPNMPIKGYGVWIGKPIHFNSPKPNDKTPHLDLKFEDNDGAWFANINVKSTDPTDSRLVYWMVHNFQHSITENLVRKGIGYHPIEEGDGLDYIRGGLINLEDGWILPYDNDGSGNDILDVLEPILKDAITQRATIYLFGAQYIDSPRKKGIHEVHMNQGSLPRYDNGFAQDGAFFLQFPDGHWEGVFLAFASQTIQTTDAGAAVEGSQTLGDIAKGDGDQDGDHGDQ
jgi:uncharacterized protein YukJ